MEEQIKQRTKQVGIRVFKLVDELPNKPSAWEIARQIIRSSASVGCNYRAACRAKSTPDFLHKLKIVEEEADETLYWLDYLEETGLMNGQRLIPLKKELNEIIAIIVASIKTSKSHQSNKNLKSKNASES